MLMSAAVWGGFCGASEKPERHLMSIAFEVHHQVHSSNCLGGGRELHGRAPTVPQRGTAVRHGALKAKTLCN